MSSLPRILAAVLLVAVAGFCSFGFLATFEPVDRETQLRWRIGYGAAIAICVVAIVRLVRPRRGDS